VLSGSGRTRVIGALVLFSGNAYGQKTPLCMHPIHSPMYCQIFAIDVKKRVVGLDTNESPRKGKLWNFGGTHKYTNASLLRVLGALRMEKEGRDHF